MASLHALVIVDVQCAFPMPDRIVKAIRTYSEGFDVRVFTRFINPKGSVFRKRIGMRSCTPGSVDTTLLISPTRGDIVLEKETYGLTSQHLTRLKRRGIKRATVCGLETDACVLGVMFTLFDAGIDCEVKPELCWSSTGLHRQALKVIATQFPPLKR